MLRYVSRGFLFMLIALSVVLSACGTEPVLVGNRLSQPAAQEAPEVTTIQSIEPTVAPAPPTVMVTAEPPAQPNASDPTVFDLLQADGRFTMFLAALDSVGLGDKLAAQDANLTVFAPSDEVFQPLLDAMGDELANNPDLLEQILRYHVSDEYVQVDELRQRNAESNDVAEPALATVPTWQERSATVAVWQDEAKVNNAQIIDSDYQATNGIVQVIDRVLIPVSLPLPESWPEELEGFDDQIMVWEPYPAGQPLPIGDAELVPGHPVVLESVNQFAELLQEDQVKINVARAVRLEENGGTTYVAPLAEQSVPSTTYEKLGIQAQDTGVDYGLMTIVGNTESYGGPGAYLRRVRTDDPDSSEWYIEFFAPGTNPDIDEPVGYAELTFLPIDVTDLTIPEAALFYGTVYCRDYTKYGYTCHRCRITEILESDWPTAQQCSQ